jgi:hypothetical protein
MTRASNLDRREFLGHAWRLGAGAAAAGLLAGCLDAPDDATEREALVSRDAPGWPTDREAIEWFCSRFTSRTITQFGYLVAGVAAADLDRAMLAWGRDHGVGPFCLVRPAPWARAFHRPRRFAITPGGQTTVIGDVASPNVELALAQVEDNAQVELILQRDLEPSTVYRAVYPGADHGGFHHACIVSNDVTADLRTLHELSARSGVQLDTLITGGAGRVLYADLRSVPQLGHHFEITQETQLAPAISVLYRAIHHLGRTVGPFGAGASAALAGLVDRERLARTNVLVEASNAAELSVKVVALAIATGWIP